MTTHQGPPIQAGVDLYWLPLGAGSGAAVCAAVAVSTNPSLRCAGTALVNPSTTRR